MAPRHAEELQHIVSGGEGGKYVKEFRVTNGLYHYQ